MHLNHLIDLSLSLSLTVWVFCCTVTSHLGARRAGDAAWGTSSTVLLAAGVAVEGGGEIAQPHLLPTPPKSVHRRQYNQINSMGPEENATTALCLLCAFQS